MAKELKQTLTDIANAIRAKDGTTTLMTSQEMPARIAAIPSGGSGETPPYDVNHFYPAKFGSFVGGDSKLHQYLKSGGDKHLYTNMSGMFKTSDIVNFDIDLDMKNVTDISTMFFSCKNLKSVSGNLDISKVTDAHQCFYYCQELTTIPILEFPNLINAEDMFINCPKLVHPKTKYTFPKATNIKNTFFYNKAQTALEIEAPLATNAYQLVSGCDLLTTLTLNAPLSTEQQYMCNGDKKLTTANITIKGGNCKQMFRGCTDLKDITLKILGSVTDASSMFEGCSSLIEAPLFSITATNASNMFENCTSLEVIPAYDLSTVTTFQSKYTHFLKTNNLKRFEAYNIGADFDITEIKTNGGQTITHDIMYSIIKGLNNTSGTTKNFIMYAWQRDVLTAEDKRIIADAGFNLQIL